MPADATGRRAGQAPVVRLVLLRHGHVDSHRGDVPLTGQGLAQADAAGRRLAGEGDTLAALLTNPGTRRTRETAAAFGAAYAAAGGRVDDPEPHPCSALRNPDLYLGGSLVSMVSSAEAFAEQAPPLTAADVTAVPFFRTFLTHPDRVGYWLAHSSPPGDDAVTTGRRLAVFARSLADVPAWRGRLVVGVTHSPLLRALALTFLGADPGEPPFLHGYSLTLEAGGALTVEQVSPGIVSAGTVSPGGA
jgi:broad specificity phosphatase PhoE